MGDYCYCDQYYDTFGTMQDVYALYDGASKICNDQTTYCCAAACPGAPNPKIDGQYDAWKLCSNTTNTDQEYCCVGNLPDPVYLSTVRVFSTGLLDSEL